MPPSCCRTILEAAVAAPNGGNRQTWGFIVVTDPTVKRDIQQYYAKAFEKWCWQCTVVAPATGHDPVAVRAPAQGRGAPRRALPRGTGVDRGVHRPRRAARSGDPHIHPAVQNILLAARALGLGATLAHRHTMYPAEVDAILGLPRTSPRSRSCRSATPTGASAGVRHGPIEEVVYQDRWDTPYTDVVSEA